MQTLNPHQVDQCCARNHQLRQDTVWASFVRNDLQVAEEKRIRQAQAWGGMLRPENAATTIQAAFRGHFTRKDLQRKERNAAELASAIKLQVCCVSSTRVPLHIMPCLPKACARI